MTDLICRKTMQRCQHPGMCSTHGGCQPDKGFESGHLDLGKFVDWVWSLKAERDQLKAENEALRKALGKISVQVDENIRCAVRDVVNGLPDVQDIYGYCDNIDEIIEAAMAKEASHG